MAYVLDYAMGGLLRSDDRFTSPFYEARCQGDMIRDVARLEGPSQAEIEFEKATKAASKVDAYHKRRAMMLAACRALVSGKGIPPEGMTSYQWLTLSVTVFQSYERLFSVPPAFMLRVEKWAVHHHRRYQPGVVLKTMRPITI